MANNENDVLGAGSPPLGEEGRNALSEYIPYPDGHEEEVNYEEDEEVAPQVEDQGVQYDPPTKPASYNSTSQVGVTGEVATDWLSRCGDDLACQKWRSLGGESATFKWRALSGDQMGSQVWGSLSVL